MIVQQKTIKNNKKGQPLTGLVECTDCGKTIERFWLKTMKRGTWRREVYASQDGRQWNGRNCPDCKMGTL